MVRLRPIFLATVLGTLLGATLLHAAAAWSEGTPLAVAFGPTAGALWSFHALFGAIIGLAVGAVGEVILIGSQRQQQHAQELERRLMTAQRMESVGRLASGVAHDFNNTLSALNIQLHLALAGSSKALENARTIATRAQSLPRQLLAVARQQPSYAQVVAIDDVLDGAAALLDRTLGDDITLKMERGGGTARIDGGLFEQVILNLCVNARDAMPEGGTIAVSSHVEGDLVVVEVVDQGTGMDTATLDRIFDPFFTTKEHGSGLGLATSVGVVEQHGGTLTATSTVGVGSTFRIRLPLEEGAMEPAIHTEPAPAAGQTILVADDSQDVRDAVAQILTDAGYKVTLAADGQDALQQLKEGPVDVLLTDVRMPRLDGHALAAEAARLWPGTRIVKMSSFASDPEVLPKPLEPARLRAALGAPRP